MRAHERMGFTTVLTFQDATDEWNILAWKLQENNKPEDSAFHKKRL